MTNIKPDNGMDPAVEGLEVVGEPIGYIGANHLADMLGPEKTWVALWNKAFGDTGIPVFAAPVQPVEQPFSETSDDLTIAYMAGHHAGRKSVEHVIKGVK